MHWMPTDDIAVFQVSRGTEREFARAAVRKEIERIME
jgi:hypothetical protein